MNQILEGVMMCKHMKLEVDKVLAVGSGTTEADRRPRRRQTLLRADRRDVTSDKAAAGEQRRA
jgi:hypothetical protein